MASQYPPTPEARAALAAYLIRDLRINPMADLIPALLGTHKVTEDNGILTIGSVSFPESLADADMPTRISEAAFVRLVIHCLALTAPLQVVASFAHAEHLNRPTSQLCIGMWHAMAFLHVAPQAVCRALQCQRPDIIQAVQRLYGSWLARCRSPQHIAQVLEELRGSSWHVESGSPACRALTALMKAAQIAAMPVRHTENADIVVDKRAGLIVSQRDKSFLALALSCGPDSTAAFNAIDAFQTARRSTPQAFEELPRGSHVLDEIN